MSIKRITNPEEFGQVIDDLYALFKDEDKHSGHQLLRHDPQMIKKCFSHVSILTWDLFCWANKTNNSYDAIICFVNDKNPKFGEKIFSEFLWLSKNPKIGYKLFSTAMKFARENEFKIVAMSTAVQHPKNENIKSFYNKMGFLKDSEIYIAKL